MSIIEQQIMLKQTLDITSNKLFLQPFTLFHLKRVW
jgi:hypothetical protein